MSKPILMNLTETERDVLFMRRCLQLAANGRATCSPNPMVGAVVVHEGEIIGEGWHYKAGRPHAEPNAIRSVRHPNLLRKATLYVSLEPCSHYGKTPPCVDLILQKQIPRVVVGCLDAFPLVAGRGVSILRAAGVDVTLGVEEAACQYLNRSFFLFHREKRPYIVLKWAQTADGFLDGIRRTSDGRESLKISTPFTQMLTHKLRSECDAILVGTRTALLDNPSLTVRRWSGRSPVRVFIDKNGLLPDSYGLLDGRTLTIGFTKDLSKTRNENVHWVRLDKAKDFLNQLMKVLYERNVQRLLVEGGTVTHEYFLDAGLWDEIHVETSDLKIGEGVAAPDLSRYAVYLRETREYDTGGKKRCMDVYQKGTNHFSG